MNDIHYRKAAADDCHALAVLKGIVWNTTYWGIYPDEMLDGYNIEKNQHIFETIAANPGIGLYVAECDGKIVGFMTCGELFRPFMHFRQEIGLLYILKEYQRMGIGKGFFDIARKQAGQNGIDEFLVSVNKLNLPAIGFYKAMGGEEILTDEKQIRFRFSV